MAQTNHATGNFQHERELKPLQQNTPAAQSQSPTQKEESEKREEIRHSIHAGSAAQVIIAVAVVLAICYVAKPVLVTILMSLLLAFILDPLVSLLEKIRVPRALGAAVAMLFLLAFLWGLTNFFYARALDFLHQLPQYSSQIRQVVAKYTKKATQLQDGTKAIMPKSQDNAIPVKVEGGPGLAEMLGNNVGTYTEAVFSLTFVPFLVYFMLTWRQHTRRATIRLFGPENRSSVYEVIKQITQMMKAFILGNFLIGIFLSIASGAVFAFLHLPYFYFLGIISGFLSLIPYLGIMLAILPPLASGLGVLHVSGIVTVAATVLGLHLFAMNVLYPKFIGKRLELNPLAVTLALLIWGWIWGAMGLILAIPITGAMKIVCDSIERLQPVGEWMGD